MNILLLTTYPHGGAGIACRRLQTALQASGHDAPLLSTDQLREKWPFYAERLTFLPYERDKSVRFSFSLANFGHDIRQHPLVMQADVLHLHWINQGFLSLQNIRQLADLGKPIVWTLHDMWAFTGGCHYSGACTKFQVSCGQCPFLRRPGPEDLSHRIWSRKKALYPPDMHIVTCSAWLENEVRKSSLLQKHSIRTIPNPIDTSIFCPATETDISGFYRAHGIARESLKLLFVAMNVREKRKGFHYLAEALNRLRQLQPDRSVELMVLGKFDPEMLRALPYPVHALGMVHDPKHLALIYSAADVFVIPSLEDNLPNTVMESLSCSTPVVGFQTGGIPEMVGHMQEGYLAPQRDPEALAQGILWVANEPSRHQTLRHAARQKVGRLYANSVVAAQYVELYHQVLKSRDR